MYYINNARFRLDLMSKMNPDIMPNFSRYPGNDVKAQWSYYQNNLDLSIGNYENLVRNL